MTETDRYNIDILNKIITDVEYAKSVGVSVYIEVEENGDKYAVLDNGTEEIKIMI